MDILSLFKSRESLNEEYLEKARKAARIFHNNLDSRGLKKIIFFGSASKGVARSDSDIDLVLVYQGAQEATTTEELEKINKELQEEGIAYGRNGGINVQSIELAMFEKSKTPYANNIRNGIDL